HIVDLERRLAVRRGLRGFDAAPLVDGDVDDHGTRRHPFQVLATHQVRSAGAGNQHSADEQVGPANAIEDVVAVAGELGHVPPHHVVEVAEAVEVDIENGHVSDEAGGDFGGIVGDDAAPQSHDVGWR